MEKILIVGIESESGRHLVRHLAPQTEVAGVPPTLQNSIPVSDLRPMTPTTPAATRLRLETDGISQVIYCGEASVSGWSAQASETTPCSDSSNLTAWSLGCVEAGVPFVFLSSDRQFDGPWVFHDEDSESLAETPRAQSIRSQEALVSERANTLIVRSHICGFSPLSLLAQHLLMNPHGGMGPDLWYATPIYAGRFAQLLGGLMARQATGIYHLGGGERISHSQLMHRLDERFPRTPRFGSMAKHVEPQASASLRETSLRCSKARRLLNEGLPTISDFLDDVAADLDLGIAQEFAEIRKTRSAKVA